MTDKLRLLVQDAESRRHADEMLIRAEIRNLRELGVSWTKIGKALGMTRQGAHQRFGVM